MPRIIGVLWGVMFILAVSVPAQGTGAPAPPQAASPGKTPDDAVSEALEAVWAKGGEAALREYVRENRAAVTRKSILKIARRGTAERANPTVSETRLRIALAAAREAHDGQAEADVLLMTGYYFFSVGDQDKALAFYDRALPLYEALGDLSGQGEVYRNRGVVYAVTDEKAQALAMYEKALPLFEQADNPGGQGQVYRNLGEIHARTGETAQALAMYEKALRCFEKADNTLALGSVYFDRGRIHARAGETEQAMAMYEQATLIFERAHFILGLGNVYLSRGEIFRSTGETAQALAMYEKALSFYERVNDPLGQGNVYKSKGQVLEMTGETARALAMYEKALPFFEKARSALGQGNVYRCRGHLYRDMGETARALAMYEKALPFFEKANDPSGQASVYFSRGNICAETGDTAQALAMYEKALPFFEKADNPAGLGNISFGRGGICARTGENRQALALYEQALAFYEKAGNIVGQANAYTCLGDIHARVGETERSLALYDKALGYYTRCDDAESQANVCFKEGLLHAGKGRDRRALELYERALDLMEQVRRRVGVEELKGAFMAKTMDCYEAAARFMLEHRLGEKAFRTAERMKARLFLDRLAEGLVDLEKGVPPERKARRDGLEARIAVLRKQKVDLQAAPVSEEERQRRITGLTADIGKAEQELNDLKVSIRLHNPLYASVQYPEVPGAAEVREKVLRPDEALLEYVFTRQDAWCFVLTTASFRVVKLPVSPEELARRVTCVLAGMTRQGGRGNVRGGKRGPEQAVDPTVEADTRRLYDGLLAPVGKEIRGKSLIIVPDGLLSRLPFELLITGSKGKPVRLLDRHAVRYVPSAAVLAFYRTTYRRAGGSNAFVGFGDPVYDWENYRAGKPERGMTVSGDAPEESVARRGLESAGVKLGRLPGTGEEVKALGALFAEQGLEGRTLLREAAREETARSEDMAKYGYIHLAAHGLLGDDYQAIALSQIPGSEEDGLLSLGEIMNLKWDARVVVLSACETGLGAVRRGEGVTGLARAVMYAGSPAAVVSLWGVSDEGTKELMTRFYRHLIRERRSPAEALRQAKREMAADPAWSAPFYWSAFVLYGE